MKAELACSVQLAYFIPCSIYINGLQSHEYHFTPSSSASKRSSLIDYAGGMKLLKTLMLYLLLSIDKSNP